MLISEITQFKLDKIENSEENIIRCPECYLIPFIFVEHSKKETILKFKCQNNHEINKPLKELYYKSKKYQLKCKNCEELDNSKLLYCIKCYGFFCEKESHSLNEGHEILIPIKKMDSSCFTEGHSDNYVMYYCKTHNINICDYCAQDEHENDNIIKFKYLKKNEIEEIKNNIYKTKENLNLFTKKINTFILNLKQIIKDINKEFSIFKENNELEINLWKDLINIYELKKKNYNLNYQIIENVKNISFQYEPIYEFNLQRILEMKNNIIKELKLNFKELKNVNKQIVKKNIQNISKNNLNNKVKYNFYEINNIKTKLNLIFLKKII